jgi:Cu+-exporting ATPase
MAGITETTTEAAANRTEGPLNGTTYLIIDGMTCGNCARHVTEALQGVTGVRSAAVSLEAHQATVRWEPDVIPDEQAAVAAVKREGFGAQVLSANREDEGAHALSGWSLNLSIGVPITVFLMVGEWWLGLATARWFEWCAFALAAIVQSVAGARFYRGAWLQAKAGSSNMDTLVALGSTTAFGYSAWALLSGAGGHLYFMEAAAIITLISAGHWIESRVSLRASSALRGLLNLAPATALRSNPDGTVTEVPVATVIEGDRVVLRPGDRIPVDGIVAGGASAVDESMLTGESVPIDKKTGSEIYTGTINLNGQLEARVTATGEQTALAHIIAAVQRAQTSRAEIQRLGDRVSNVFVPIVIGVALGCGLFWGIAPTWAAQIHEWLGRFLWHSALPQSAIAAAFIMASAVLIIACPCAMGLATPAAIMAGSNVAAQRGILIRDAVALEKAGRISAVLFDKTGTLTFGKPKIVDLRAFPDGSGSEHRQQTDGSSAGSLAAALARPSNHPISKIIAMISSKQIGLSEWREIHGAGVQARNSAATGGWAIARLGSLQWLRENGVDLNPGSSFIDRWSKEGASIVGVSRDSALAELIAVQDTVKPGAFEVVQRLRRSGLKTFLVTGDNGLTAKSVAQQAGIPKENVFAEVRPEQKAELVRKLQDQGERVAFAGDGINDAPALEQSDLGIAVSRASDIAREAADIILLKSEIEAIPESLGLARATLRVIKQNLFWAFFYNALGIPLAALGFMSPILCAAAMGLSDLVVIGNALRLRLWRL